MRRVNPILSVRGGYWAGPWTHSGSHCGERVFIVQGNDGLWSFALESTGEPSSRPWTSKKIVDFLLEDSMELSRELWPMWAIDPLLQMDEGL